MFDLLHKHITNKVALSSEEWEVVKTLFIPKKLRKKQYLLQAGDVAQYTAFVSKGVLRSYTVDEKGEEHIVQFALEGWWIGDMSSLLTGESSMYNIDAIEETEMLLIDGPSWEKMCEVVPKMEKYHRILFQNAFIALHRRLVTTISATAEEKYLQIQKLYPDLMQRVPQHMIASYLGLKPETLSRVRKKLLEDK